MRATGSYASFLVRVWRAPDGKDGADAVPWRAELESIQSGELWRFADLAALVGFLEETFEEADGGRGR